ncbi:MAG: LLM class flavin-dependent oxidoreductase [Panacagrimonas sp.]
MKFGVFDHVDYSDLPLGEHLENRLKLAEVYDRCGIHGYHVAEHHSTPLGYAPSPSVLLAAVAQRTRRMKIGPLVYLLPMYHPLRLMEEICMLDHMSQGRFMLGVGRGVSPHELRLFGVDLSKAQEMYAESLEILMRGFREDKLTFHGKHYRFENVPMTLRPVQQPHPELWYGILTPDTTVWAAANNVNVVTLALNEGARHIADRYRAEWAKLGKPASALPLIGVSRHIVVAETDKEAKEIARRAYRKWFASFDKLWLDNGMSVRQAYPPIALLYPDTWDEVEAVGNGCAGSPETVLRFVKEEAERTTMSYLVSWFAFGDLSLRQVTRSAELFGRHVIPAFEKEARKATA